MGEYQYYEFLAIDRPLTWDEMAALRALSTRARITPVSFTNEYHWGNFKGDPTELMKRYFDAHVYVANWMTAIFMVRVPMDCLTQQTAEAIAVADYLEITSSTTHWIIRWCLEESENYDRFGMEDGPGWMARLAPVRDELLRGDLRSLYIGWLAAVGDRKMDDEAVEPLSVSGLGNLTAAQQTLAEFLEVDPDLLAGAGMGSPPAQEAGVSQREMEKWIDTLPRDEVHSILKQLLEGNGQKAQRSVRSRFASWRRTFQTGDTETPRRAVAELRRNAEKARQLRLEKEKQEQRQQEHKRRKRHRAYLETLSKDFPKAWALVKERVERGSGLGYDEACRVLVDLAEAYALFATIKEFQEELKKFMAGHMRRKAFMERLVKAGLWKEK